MYTLSTLIAVALGTLALGLIIGFAIASRRGTNANGQRELDAHLTEMQGQQEQYQQEVSDHFSKTAALLDQLNESYREVHNHLAQGAQALAAAEASEQLQALEASDNEAVDEESLSPPLDYAPKTQPNQEGMLSESFGIEKQPTPEEPIETQAARHAS